MTFANTIYKTYRTKVNRKQKRKKRGKGGTATNEDESLKYETNQSHDQCMFIAYYRVHKLTLHFRATSDALCYCGLAFKPYFKTTFTFFEAMLNNLHTFQANILKL